ncbi:MAG: DUF1707 domain-containing protein [Propionibacteriaceae bacterium]|nr:DUF1707 domain-containing protein [Propionibacteriaceae bacterium]
MTDEQLRIGDQERDQTAGALTEHFAAGRLTREELDHRTGVVLRARTVLDLREVLADLPRLDRPAPAPAPTTAPADTDIARKARNLWRAVGLAPWALFAVVFIGIWALTGAGYFWPVWPIMGWGIGVVTTGMLAHRAPARYLERQAARRHPLAH